MAPYIRGRHNKVISKGILTSQGRRTLSKPIGVGTILLGIIPDGTFMIHENDVVEDSVQKQQIKPEMMTVQVKNKIFQAKIRNSVGSN